MKRGAEREREREEHTCGAVGSREKREKTQVRENGGKDRSRWGWHVTSLRYVRTQKEKMNNKNE